MAVNRSTFLSPAPPPASSAVTSHFYKPNAALQINGLSNKKSVLIFDHTRNQKISKEVSIGTRTGYSNGLPAITVTNQPVVQPAAQRKEEMQIIQKSNFTFHLPKLKHQTNSGNEAIDQTNSRHAHSKNMLTNINYSKIRQSIATQQQQQKQQKGKSLPLTPTEALQLYRYRLTAFEQEEIKQYEQIWFVGGDVKKVDGSRDAEFNNGYDDNNGSYLKVTGDHMAYRYEIMETIGRGSFGQVVRAIDHKTKQEVAIKIVRNKRRFHHQGAIEVKILNTLKSITRAHIVQILEHFNFRNHLCIVFELLGNNLYEEIKRQAFRGFRTVYTQHVVRGILQCLCVLRQEKIIHCDLKPENILMVSRTNRDIRVIDFGSSCYEDKKVYTYIQSRFYRAPEVILGIPYSAAIDIWSMGCIIAELCTGTPLFPGENEIDQLACIMELRGVPPSHLLEKASRRHIFFDSQGACRNLVDSRGRKRVPASKELHQVLAMCDEKMCDFISKCLEWDPDKRFTPNAAIQHPWLREFKVLVPSNQHSPLLFNVSALTANQISKSESQNVDIQTPL